MIWWMLVRSASAHGGAVPTRGVYDWSSLPVLPPGGWIVWQFFPSIIIGCTAFVAGYAALAGPLRRKWNLSPVGPTRGEWIRFHLAIAIVFCALQGPLHELSDRYLFSGHMIQHLLLTLVFAQLFVQGIPPWMWKPLVRHPAVARFGRFITWPPMALGITTVGLWFWHVPRLYDLALQDHNVHIAEHLVFMASAVVMWWPAWSRLEEIPPLTSGYKMVYLFMCTIPMKSLGAIITVSDYLIYQYYATQPRVFGLDPMVDQRVGGLIMWLPGGLIIWYAIGHTFFTNYYRDFQRSRSGAPAVAPVAG